MRGPAKVRSHPSPRPRAYHEGHAFVDIRFRTHSLVASRDRRRGVLIDWKFHSIENQYNNQVKIMRAADEHVFASTHRGVAGPSRRAAIDPLSTIDYYDCLFFLALKDSLVL